MIGSRGRPPFTDPWPAEYEGFLKRWGAPAGHQEFARQAAYRLARRIRSLPLQARAIGPFGFQPTSGTRRFEYPWAFFAVPINAQHTVIELGGSFSGFQFALASTGATVITVDPGTYPSGDVAMGRARLAAFNRAFRTHVEWRNDLLEEAGFKEGAVDRIYCISTAEHIPDAGLKSLAIELGRVLRPGGYAVFTVDLFYDLAPFTNRRENSHGRNIDVRQFIEWTGLTLEQGNRSELCGFPEFDAPSVLASADEHIQGDIALNTAQAFVLTKPELSS